jgi:hypothetical protein
MKTILGIDPGNQGAFFALYENDAEISATYERMPLKDLKPDWSEVNNILQNLLIGENVKVIIEQQFIPRAQKHNLEHDCVRLTNYGIIIGMVFAMTDRMPIEVKPHVWRKEMLGIWHREGKISPLIVKKLYPKVNLRPGMCKVDHTGIADACLIAEWGRRKIV